MSALEERYDNAVEQSDKSKAISQLKEIVQDAGLFVLHQVRFWNWPFFVEATSNDDVKIKENAINAIADIYVDKK